MPFVNQKQRAACYAKAREAKNRGKKPTWDCKKWELKVYRAYRVHTLRRLASSRKVIFTLEGRLFLLEMRSLTQSRQISRIIRVNVRPAWNITRRTYPILSIYAHHIHAF